jgi:hypothetical protein
MAKSSVSPLRQGRNKTAHTLKSRTSIYGKGSLYSRKYELGSTPLNVIQQDVDPSIDEIHYGVELPAYPMEVVDYFGHYFLPVEKAA